MKDKATQLIALREKLVQQMPDSSTVLPGSLLSRMVRYNKPGCRFCEKGKGKRHPHEQRGGRHRSGQARQTRRSRCPGRHRRSLGQAAGRWRERRRSLQPGRCRRQGYRQMERRRRQRLAQSARPLEARRPRQSRRSIHRRSPLARRGDDQNRKIENAFLGRDAKPPGKRKEPKEIFFFALLAPLRETSFLSFYPRYRCKSSVR